MARTKPAQFEDRMTIVEHLDELRSRIIVSLVAFGIAFALCFWQNHLLLDAVNAPLPNDTEPVTLSPTEPFFTTVEISAYGAFVLAMPILLYELWAFILPAFSPRERRAVTPFVFAMPLLFLAGIAFAYFVVMPVAVKFLLNFNDAQFNIQVRAGEYYSFFGLTELAMGILFQIPIVMLSLTRLDIVSADWFAKNRRYAIFIISIIAAAAPGGDPVSMMMIMIPLVLLYEVSIIVDRRFGRPASERVGGEVSPGEAG